MSNLIATRWRQGKRTLSYPEQEPLLPEQFRGLPIVDDSRCIADCRDCVEACPTDAIFKAAKVEFDLGRCLFCPDCSAACGAGAVEMSHEFRLATTSREELMVESGATMKLARRMSDELHRVLGRSLKLRQVSAGGCNACEAEVSVLNTVVFDLGRFGIEFVASPRHADGLLITGAITRNMQDALAKTYAAVPEPKIVVAVGACAISGGPFRDGPEILNGAENLLTVDLFVPGCPPHPLTILDGLLRLIGKIQAPAAR